MFDDVKSELAGYEYAFKGWYQLDVEEKRHIGNYFTNELQKKCQPIFSKMKKLQVYLQRLFRSRNLNGVSKKVSSVPNKFK